MKKKCNYVNVLNKPQSRRRVQRLCFLNKHMHKSEGHMIICNEMLKNKDSCIFISLMYKDKCFQILKL